MKNVREHFPALHRKIYANTAAAGLLSTELLRWRQQHDTDYLFAGSTMKARAMTEGILEVRRTVARFFGAEESGTALVPNFSIGLNILIEGLNKGHKVLLVENDYPSVNWPFEYRGFDVDYAELNSRLEENIFEKIRSNNISILALSLVQWVNGIKIDMGFLKTLKKDFPKLIIVADGTQFCGTTDFNFEDSPIDVLGASAYKWLLSGYGCGFMLFKNEIMRHFTLKTTGFNAANIDLNGRDNVTFAKHFEPGHLDTLNFGSLKFSLEYLENIGIQNIATKIDKLSKMVKKRIYESGAFIARGSGQKSAQYNIQSKGR